MPSTHASARLRGCPAAQGLPTAPHQVLCTQVGTKRTVEFVYDDSVDTPDTVAVEISNEFALSETDKDICAAALKEWLAKEGSGVSDS